MITTKENWKPVLGYEGRYEVSDHGNVRNATSGKLVNKRLNYNGYYYDKKQSPRRYRVDLSDGLKNGRKSWKSFYVAVLVAKAFLGDFGKPMTVDHFDDNCQNDVLSNLRIITHKENNSRRQTRNFGKQFSKSTYKKKKTGVQNENRN